MKKLALLVLCDVVDRVGGTESYLARVLPELARRGVDVTIAGRRVRERGAFGIAAREIAWGSDDEAPRPEAARDVERLIAECRPHVVMTSNVHDHTVIAAARTAPRLIVRVHDHRLFCPQGDRQFPHVPSLCTKAMSTSTCVGNALVRGCAAGLSVKTVQLVRARQALRDVMLLADRFVVASEFVARLCAINGVLPHRITTIAPPYEGLAVSSVRPRPEVDRVLFAGRLVRDKGLRSLIEAVALVPLEARPELAVAGAPTRDSQPLPALAAARGVRLAMLGRLDPAALIAEIDASTCVAVPSLWPEPFGLMGIEAQARARPAVAYDVGGIGEWMGEAGVLAPRGDREALARGLREVMDARRWPTYAAAALRQSDRYRLDRHVEPLIAVLAAEPVVTRTERESVAAIV